MSCVIEEVPFDPTDYDKALGELLLGHEGDTGAFLTSVFSFLKRKTNFFKEGEPRRRILDALRATGGEAAAAGGSDGFRAGFLGGGGGSASRPKQVRARVRARVRACVDGGGRRGHVVGGCMSMRLVVVMQAVRGCWHTA
jgi:hypothetical protein